MSSNLTFVAINSIVYQEIRSNMLPEFPALGTNMVQGEQRKCPAGAGRGPGP